MPKNEEGEFELILGNRQLMSVFFIVVVLLAVFFAMGYVVGRNSGPLSVADATGTRKPETSPLVVDSAARARSAQPPAATEASGGETASTKRRGADSDAEPAPARGRQPQDTHETAKAAQPPHEDTASSQAGGLSGTYLQLAATSQHEAEVLADVLRKKSFKALAVEIPEKPGTFRVLVGPLADGTINKTRADLSGAGFPGDKAIRRAF